MTTTPTALATRIIAKTIHLNQGLMPAPDAATKGARAAPPLSIAA
eukprot:CAMPEP_0183498298 /NCGR_PEP_ID=MMETSP0371-20130417/676_1 /TAXON_ID=268820 /ORGANISM="Peridinium aciculiferum, Strain PAER-2" /LENGTH=44 /DNA_ID= /DNA_START= /DNA_END= /DNA_ORIENTATION=